ncbi:MAG: hypothetical protein AAB453_04715 [Patescibacteria group bacterium]
MKTLRREIIERFDEAKKRRRKINFLLLGIIVILLLVLVTLGFNHPRLAFRQIILIDKSEKLDKPAILHLTQQKLNEQFFYFLNKSNYFFYPAKELKETLLLKFPNLKRLVFKREANTLQLVAESRTPEYLWCHPAEEFCQYLDNEGVALGLAPKFSGQPLLIFSPVASSTPVTALGASPFTHDEFIKLLTLMTSLSETIKASTFSSYILERLLVARGGDYHVQFFRPTDKVQSLTILFSLKNSPTSTLAYLNSVFNSPEFKTAVTESASALKTLDTRFNQKVFYEFW